MNASSGDRNSGCLSGNSTANPLFTDTANKKNIKLLISILVNFIIYPC